MLAVAFAERPDGLPDVRLQVSLRLKAARHLAGGLRKGKKGGFEAGPYTVEELAQHELIVTNGIRRNRLDAYEQMKTDPRPMELQVIADALGVPREFLLAPLTNAGQAAVGIDLPPAPAALQRPSDDPELAQRLGRIEKDLSELVAHQREAQEQLRNFDVEDARELLNLIQEVQARQGQHAGKRTLQSRAAMGHQPGRA